MEDSVGEPASLWQDRPAPAEAVGCNSEALISSAVAEHNGPVYSVGASLDREGGIAEVLAAIVQAGAAAENARAEERARIHERATNSMREAMANIYWGGHSWDLSSLKGERAVWSSLAGAWYDPVEGVEETLAQAEDRWEYGSLTAAPQALVGAHSFDALSIGALLFLVVTAKKSGALRCGGALFTENIKAIAKAIAERLTLLDWMIALLLRLQIEPTSVKSLTLLERVWFLMHGSHPPRAFTPQRLALGY